MIAQDLRHAFRSLRRNPGFSLVVTFTLAIALGAALAMLSLVDAVLLRPLPFAEPERLVALWDSNPQDGHEKVRVSGANFLAWRERARDTFDGLALYRFKTFTLTGAGDPVQLTGSAVTADFFPLLGITPTLGRSLEARDFTPGAPPAVVLSDALWRRHLGADPALLGSNLSFDGQPYTVVGILPRQILPQRALPVGRVELGADDAYFWIPLPEVPPNPNSHLFGVLARLRRGVTLEQAKARMDGIAAGLARELPESNLGYGVALVPLVEEAVGEVASSLWLLLGAVGLLLLIAYVNLVNLLLIRADARVRELAVRTALGAGWQRLWRNLVTEGFLLAAAGTVGGSLLCFWALRLLAAAGPQDVPRLDEASLGFHTVLAALALCLVSAGAFALVPALRVPRGAELPASLRGAGRVAGASLRSLRFRRLLAGAEMALAVTLLIGSALLVKSLQRLQAVDPGFTARQVLSLELQHRPERYSKLEDLTGFYAELFRQVGALPGITAVAASYDPPLSSTWSQSFGIEGAPEPAPGEERAALYRTVTPGYFVTLGIPLASGRLFREDDDTHAAGAAIVNRSFVRAYLADRPALGQRLLVPGTEPAWGDEVPEVFTIVGVVADERLGGLAAAAEPAFYLPFRQTPHPKMTAVIRTAGDPLALLPAVRRELAALDPELPIAKTATLDQIVDAEVAQPRFNAWILGTFAGCSLLLAIIGLWGVLSLNARQRTHEIGIRMAVGADRGRVFGLLVRQGLMPALAGIAAGVAGALALSRLVRGMLYAVSPTDPAVYVLVPAGLLLVALLACCAPARRASATDPMEVLRAE